MIAQCPFCWRPYDADEDIYDRREHVEEHVAVDVPGLDVVHRAAVARMVVTAASAARESADREIAALKRHLRDMVAVRERVQAEDALVARRVDDALAAGASGTPREITLTVFLGPVRKHLARSHAPVGRGQRGVGMYGRRPTG